MTQGSLLIDEYENRIKKFKYLEYPECIGLGKITTLNDFIDFDELSLEVKIHLSSMLIRRSVGIPTGIYLPDDTYWFISRFVEEYIIDLADPSRHEAHKKALIMIMSEHAFSDCIIGTTYMYTVIEFCLKYKLGYKVFPMCQEEFENNKKFNDMSIGNAYFKVKKANFGISRELHLIDEHFKKKAQKMEYNAEELQNCQIQGRLNASRNKSLHGHYQFFHSEGTLLALLFILFHYCEAYEKTT